MTPPISRRDLDFLLFDLLDLGALPQRPRFAAHTRQTVAAMLDTAEAIAAAQFAPHNRAADEHEPRIENGRVVLRPEVGVALRHFIDAGFMAATADEACGGLQLPFLAHMATSAIFSAANIGTMAYAFLTMAAAATLRAHGSAEQQERYMRPMLEGRFFGTMALTEPQAGSSLADIRSVAEPAGDGSYRLRGSKIFISAGEHELAENIIHLVLARIAGAPAGVKGISLFVVPRRLINDDGSLGARNDVRLAGLIHKMGYRGTTSTMLNFGEAGGAVAFLVGAPHQGLGYMFHMMNEARITVGNGAAALACAGYRCASDYARQRLQGRPAHARDRLAPPVPIIEHADVRRMLLTQKAYAEGALALTLFAAHLVDEAATAPGAAAAEAGLLLSLLTPIAKSWPSRWGLKANDLAIQVLGGFGYTRDYPVEQYYRDNRLNPIHEGTHGIQAIDLLGRKVALQDGAGLRLLSACIAATTAAAGEIDGLRDHAAALDATMCRVVEVTADLVAAQRAGAAERVLANASVYLDMLGHVVVAWLWLRQAILASAALPGAADAETRAFCEGKLHACRYFFRWELPATALQLDALARQDDTWLVVPPACL